MNPFEKAKAKIEEMQRQKMTERQSAAEAAAAATLAFVEKFEPVLHKLESLFTPSLQSLMDTGYEPIVDRKMFPITQVEASLVFASNEIDPACGLPHKYRIAVVVRNNFSSQIGCELMRGDALDLDSRMVKRFLFRPVALPSFKHEEFDLVFNEKLERIFTKILQSEPSRGTEIKARYANRR